MVKIIKTISDIQKENFPERIEKAKVYAKEQYIKFCEELKMHNTEYKRSWIKRDQVKKGTYMLELFGSPPKALVFVDEESNSVKAFWLTGNKEF